MHVHWKLRRQNIQRGCNLNRKKLTEHPRCDKTREGRKHARGEKWTEESSLFLFLSRVSSVSRYVLSRAACSYISAFSERRAYSRCTEDRRCQSWATGVETLDFTIGICSTLTFLYFDLYLNTAYAANVYLQLCLFYNYNVNRKRIKYYSIN